MAILNPQGRGGDGVIKARRFWPIAAGLMIAAVPSVSGAAAARRGATARSAHASRKADPVNVLAYHLAVNTLHAGDNVAEVCRRTDFKTLAIALSLNKGLLHQEKGEYETTEQFNERASKLAAAVNDGDKIFCQPLDDNEDLPFRYNADERHFAGSFNQSQNVWRDIKKLGSYRSKTRMGISATVKASVSFEYNVELRMPGDDTSCGRISAYSSTYQFAVPVAAVDAPAVKARGYAAFIGKLASPYIRESRQSGSPTLDDPYDEYENDYVVTFRPERIIIVDGTGKQLWSCSPDFPKPNSAPRPMSNPAVWVTSDDYPYLASREHRQGRVGFALGIDTSGRVQTCAVTQSSGSTDLDERTCSVIRIRARFKPATDANSEPVAGTYASSILWTL
ncbi:energy transducer TonB [Parablastomonas sp. CN1-191]|uniref:energy transducer TonB n=1 Tax=Parablastomonas sp. CN1-191 TaxID=3400908 RepID=UPI003BF91A4D